MSLFLLGKPPSCPPAFRDMGLKELRAERFPGGLLPMHQVIA